MNSNTSETKTKVCSKCKIEKPRTVEYFYRCRRSRYGLKSACKECLSKDKKEYWRKNKHRPEIQAKYNEYNMKEYYIKNREEILKGRKRYYIENADRIKASASEYSKTKRGKEVKRLSKQRRKNNKKKVLSTLTLSEWKQCEKHF